MPRKPPLPRPFQPSARTAPYAGLLLKPHEIEEVLTPLEDFLALNPKVSRAGMVSVRFPPHNNSEVVADLSSKHTTNLFRSLPALQRALQTALFLAESSSYLERVARSLEADLAASVKTTRDESRQEIDALKAKIAKLEAKS